MRKAYSYSGSTGKLLEIKGYWKVILKALDILGLLLELVYNISF